MSVPALDRVWSGRSVQDRILAEARAGSSNCFGGTREMERSVPIHRTRRLGFREQTAPRSETDMGPGDLTQVHSSSCAASRDSETIGWHTFRHTFSTLLRSVGTEFKVMQELLRHSSLRSTLDVYTQAISPAKHAAQAAVLALVFASETSPSALA